MQNQNYLVYSNAKISQLVSALGEINLKGISSVKNMTTVLAILESPDRVVPAEELEKEKKEEPDEEG
jgi:hypothetical protein